MGIVFDTVKRGVDNLQGVLYFTILQKLSSKESQDLKKLENAYNNDPSSLSSAQVARLTELRAKIARLSGQPDENRNYVLQPFPSVPIIVIPVGANLIGGLVTYTNRVDVNSERYGSLIAKSVGTDVTEIDFICSAYSTAQMAIRSTISRQCRKYINRDDVVFKCTAFLLATLVIDSIVISFDERNTNPSKSDYSWSLTLLNLAPNQSVLQRADNRAFSIIRNQALPS